MKDTYTHICVILDRSGSMEGIRNDTIGGFNAFVRQQKEAPGTATLSLVQFDNRDPFEVVHAFVPIGDVPPLTREMFVPRAGTPLLDAVGRTINHTEEMIAKMADFCRPDAVIIAIITDGQENSSLEFKPADIVRMIEAKEKLSGWKFVFLSADMSAVADAVQYGIKAASSRYYRKSSQGTLDAWNSLSTGISDMRRGTSEDIDLGDDSGSSSGNTRGSGS